MLLLFLQVYDVRCVCNCSAKVCLFTALYITECFTVTLDILYNRQVLHTLVKIVLIYLRMFIYIVGLLYDIDFD